MKVDRSSTQFFKIQQNWVALNFLYFIAMAQPNTKNSTWFNCCSQQKNNMYQAQVDLTDKTRPLFIQAPLKDLGEGHPKPYIRVFQQTTQPSQQVKILPPINPFPYPTFTYVQTKQTHNPQQIIMKQKPSVALQQTRLTKREFVESSNHKPVSVFVTSGNKQIYELSAIKEEQDKAKFNAPTKVIENSFINQLHTTTRKQVIHESYMHEKDTLGDSVDQLTRLINLQSQQLAKLKQIILQAKRNQTIIQ